MSSAAATPGRSRAAQVDATMAGKRRASWAWCKNLSISLIITGRSPAPARCVRAQGLEMQPELPGEAADLVGGGLLVPGAGGELQPAAARGEVAGGHLRVGAAI